MSYQVAEISLTQENIDQLIKAMGTEKILVVVNSDTDDAIICGTAPYKANDLRDAQAIADVLNGLKEGNDGPAQAT